jgi:hypothetical protein
VELELLVWGDGTTRLTYEDYMEGKDRVFLLDANGNAFETQSNADDTETLTPVNLVLILREMLTGA